ncbi:MAG TPA: hypothetical protein VMS17_05045, partial [Gemmataceae bacterium]|nr:hypothetical protein [Gemmataceae bacterium]
MSIQVRCPKCQESCTFPNDQRGRQVRCPHCAKVLQLGKPPAKTSVAAKPKSAAAPRRVPAAERSEAAPESGGISRNLMLVLVLVGVGVVAVAAAGVGGVVWFLNRPASTPVAAAPTNPTPPAQPVNNPSNTGNTDPQNSLNSGNPSTPNQSGQSGAPSNPPAATLTKENFDKIDTSMGIAEVRALLGPETDIGRKPPEYDFVSGQTKIVVIVMLGKVVKKENNQGWSVVYPSGTPGAAPTGQTVTKDNFDKIDRGMTEQEVIALLGPSDGGSPPSAQDQRILSWTSKELKIAVSVTFKDGKATDKSAVGKQSWRSVYPSDTAGKTPPAPKVQITQDLFNQIDKGMTMDQVVALAGPPTMVQDHFPTNPDVDTRLSWDNYVADIGFTVDLFQGKVTSKRGYSKGKLWPVVYPSGAAPMKPVGTLTRASFDKIDKGMSMDDVVALVGQPTFNVPLDPAKFQGVDTQLTFTSINPNAAATISMFQGKVVKKENAQKWPIA